MQTLILFGLAGLLGQLVDGTLGMAFGVTSTTTLVALGTAPAVASASIHIAEVGTSLASGVAHWKFRNIDWRTVGILAVPGAVGATAGAYFLTSLAADVATIWIAGVLFLLGLYVLVRFAFLELGKLVTSKRPGVRFLGPLGLVAGFVDATGGGGWGPLGTTTLLSSGRLEPRKVVGSITASELVVAVAASGGFLFSLSRQNLNFTVILGLLIGGVIAAPFAAWLVRKMPPRVLGTAAGGLIVLTNARTVLAAAGVGGVVIALAYVTLLALWIAGLATSIRAVRAEKRVNALAGEDIGTANTERV